MQKNPSIKKRTELYLLQNWIKFIKNTVFTLYNTEIEHGF